MCDYDNERGNFGLTQYRDLVLTVVGLLALDHFVCGGKFQKTLKNMVGYAISEVVDGAKSIKKRRIVEDD